MKSTKLLPAFCGIVLNSFSQGTWIQKSNLAVRDAGVGFSIGTKGYMGTGDGGPIWPFYQKDFWEWDQASNTWTQKADFGGTARRIAVGFSIGIKGYIGTGLDINSQKKDFWEWDQASNTWTQKADFGGTARWGAVGFSIGNKGYIGTGFDNTGVNKQDFWEWDQVNNIWTQKTDFGGTGRQLAVGFSTGTKGYIGTGSDANTYPVGIKDFWEWDQANNTWTQKADFGGTARAEATGFSIGSYGYIGIGTTVIGGNGSIADFWKYDPSTNAWTSIPDFGGGLREMAAGFSIGCKGYVGTGFINDLANTVNNDLWEYCPDTACCKMLNITISSQNVLCNGQCNGSATITPSGNTYSWSNGQVTQTCTGLCAGTYSVTVTDAANNSSTATVTITQPIALSSSVTITNTNCNAQCNGSSVITAGGGTPGYIYSWSTTPAQTTTNATGLCTGNYIATITDANNCITTQTVAVASEGSITTNQSGGLCSGSTYTLPGGTVVNTGGTYTDTLTSANGCDSIIMTNLTVNPNPTAFAFSNTIITQGQSITLTASGGGTYSWSSGESASTITVTPATTTIYCVTVMDANNCTDTACVTVTIEPIDCSNSGELYIPNAFSPNGDGENDVLKLYYGNPKCIKIFKLVLYDRWGEKVFQTKSPMSHWDGYYKGKPQNTAAFVYYLEATLISGEEIIRKGNISILR